MSRQKQKGTRYERQCVLFWRGALRDPTIDRVALHGTTDEGDVRWLRPMAPWHVKHMTRGILECKCYERYTPSDIARFRMETLAERDNSGAGFAVLMMHVKGGSIANDRCQLLLGDLMHAICDGEGSPAPDIWVELPAHELAELMQP